MRVAIMTAGSRGDAAPFTGLGAALARRGHDVTLVTHARFRPLAADTGVTFHALPVDPHEELHSARGRALHRSSTGAGKLARVVALARALAGELTDGLVDAAPGTASAPRPSPNACPARTPSPEPTPRSPRPGRPDHAVADGPDLIGRPDSARERPARWAHPDTARWG